MLAVVGLSLSILSAGGAETKSQITLAPTGSQAASGESADGNESERYN